MKPVLHFLFVFILCFINIFSGIGQTDGHFIIKSPSKYQEIEEINLSLCDICPKKNCDNCNIYKIEGEKVNFSKKKHRIKESINLEKEYIIVITYTDGRKEKFYIKKNAKGIVKIKVD